MFAAYALGMICLSTREECAGLIASTYLSCLQQQGLNFSASPLQGNTSGLEYTNERLSIMFGANSQLPDGSHVPSLVTWSSGALDSSQVRGTAPTNALISSNLSAMFQVIRPECEFVLDYSNVPDDQALAASYLPQERTNYSLEYYPRRNSVNYDQIFFGTMASLCAQTAMPIDLWCFRKPLPTAPTLNATGTSVPDAEIIAFDLVNQQFGLQTVTIRVPTDLFVSWSLDSNGQPIIGGAVHYFRRVAMITELGRITVSVGYDSSSERFLHDHHERDALGPSADSRADINLNSQMWLHNFNKMRAVTVGATSFTKKLVHGFSRKGHYRTRNSIGYYYGQDKSNIIFVKNGMGWQKITVKPI